MRQVIREAFRYIAASGAALAVDVGFLLLLVEQFHWHYLIAATASFLAGTAVVYALSVSLIFSHRSVDDWRLEFGLFAGIGVLGVLVNLAVLKIAVDSFGVHYLVGKLASIIFTFSLNFGLRRALLFTAPSNPRRPHQTTTGLSE
jgi:putative flippase GtrA